MCITEMYMHKSLITFQLRNFLFKKNPQKGFHEKKSWQLAGVLLTMIYFLKRTMWWDYFDDPYYSMSDEEVRVFGSLIAAKRACTLESGELNCKITKAEVYTSELVEGEYIPVKTPLMVVEE